MSVWLVASTMFLLLTNAYLLSEVRRMQRDLDSLDALLRSKGLVS